MQEHRNAENHYSSTSLWFLKCVITDIWAPFNTIIGSIKRFDMHVNIQ